MTWSLAAFLAVAGMALVPSAAAQEAVDVELVLTADGSGSIDDDELAFQRSGYADAITSPDVLNAIRSNMHGAIAVAYVEWGGPESQHLIVDWHMVRDEASAEAFAEKVRTEPRQAYGYNSISAAIDFSVRLIESNDYEGMRQVIDVSGDGPNIGGRPVQLARNDAVDKGMVVNGLVIERPGGTVRLGREPLSQHYERDVIGGPGAFVMVADETRSFHDAVRSKLIQEIAGVEPGRRRAAIDSGVRSE